MSDREEFLKMSSPQRRRFYSESDLAASRALEMLRKKIPDRGSFHPQTAQGAAWYSDEYGPNGLHIIISFKDGRTNLQICCRHQNDQIIPVFQKELDGYNLDAGTRFLKDAEKIVSGLNSLY